MDRFLTQRTFAYFHMMLATACRCLGQLRVWNVGQSLVVARRLPSGVHTVSWMGSVKLSAHRKTAF